MKGRKNRIKYLDGVSPRVPLALYQRKRAEFSKQSDKDNQGCS